ncbi:MAG TPA: sugar ABC transporter permease [Gemmatimonadaceae bacterium]|nr:sugar ABC transporter permease [Gemmatimonadaceae bacterium]
MNASARTDRRLAWLLVTPAVATIALIAIFPLLYTFWESLHQHDLRLPWLGKPFVGLGNYVELAGDGRFWWSLVNTGFFAATTITLEMVFGLALALAMQRAVRARGAVRALALLPWAIPTVVAALLWRFIFDAQAGIANAVLVSAGAIDEPLVWFARASTAWVPVILADVWKTTPFVALLLLAGLQTIDPALHEAAAVDGAGPWRRLRHVTLPLLAPALLVALIFRTLDAFRVFDLIYVLTGGGPGTSTEPVALYAFTTTLQHLRFGYGSAISVAIFVITFALAMIYVRVIGRER